MIRDPRLSEQQDRALRYAAEGYPRKQIAAYMGISPRTLDNHLDAAYRALGVGDLVSAVRAAGILVPSRSRRRRAKAEQASLELLA